MLKLIRLAFVPLILGLTTTLVISLGLLDALVRTLFML